MHNKLYALFDWLIARHFKKYFENMTTIIFIFAMLIINNNVFIFASTCNSKYVVTDNKF